MELTLQKKMLNKLKTTAKKISNIQPFSIRGFVAIAFALICIIYFGDKKSDLVATVVGACIFITITISLLILALFAYKIIVSLKQTSDLDDTQKLIAKEISKVSLYINKLYIPPFFTLNIKREFIQSTVKSSLLKLSGSFQQNSNYSVLTDNIIFPHRGEYLQSGFKLTFGDALGLTRITTTIPKPRSFKVHPKEVQIQAIPIMATSAQLGDIQHSNLERTGDLFDIREYQPGDSLKRVLWKVYARSNNLVVRHPEPAIVPEGELALFIYAQAEDDEVAASALSYLRILEDQNIIYSVSCLGNDKILARTIEESEKQLITSAQNANRDDGTSFKNFIDELKRKNFSSQKIIIFAPHQIKEENKNSKNYLTSLTNIIRTSDSNSLALAFAFVKAKPVMKTKLENNTWLKHFDNKTSQFLNNKIDLNKIKTKINSKKELSSTKSLIQNSEATDVQYADF